MQTLDTGCIYKITCDKTSKSYIGQCSLHKFKDGKPYRYGMSGRWSDHVSDARFKLSPLHTAIREYGPNAFSLQLLEEDKLVNLDAKESQYILEHKTLYPDGYNVMRHSRVKLREDTNIHERYLNSTISAEVKPIKCNGVYKLLYVYLLLDNGEKIRLTFGQAQGSTIKDAYTEAEVFLKPFEDRGITIKSTVIHDLDDVASKYKDKIELFSGKKISRIRYAKVDTRCVIHISLEDSPGWKNDKKISFGGKTTDFASSYNTAKVFVSYLSISETTKIIDSTVDVSNR